MKSFKRFFKEEEDRHGFESYFTPAVHLRNKQAQADKTYDQTKGVGAGASVTAQFTKNVKLPTHILNAIPGANGEEKFRDDASNPKNVSLEKEIGSPENFDSSNKPIAISVNHRGEAFVHEGNHRIAYAKRHGIPHVDARISYHLGGEDVNGPYHPDKLKAIAK